MKRPILLPLDRIALSCRWKPGAVTAAPAVSSKSRTTKGLEVGDRMEDGTIFAGISPDTGRNMFVTPKDAPGTLEWKAAMKYAADIDANGHKDWKLPTKAELEVLHQNRDKSALKGTFNESGSDLSGWYWSATEGPDDYPDEAWLGHPLQCRGWYWKGIDAAVRPVRSEPRP